MTTTDPYERYKRQVTVKEFGEAGQQKLAEAKVLIIGAGGLGCPAIQYLAAAGVGEIGIADGDLVSLNNLHRQTIYSVDDIGKNKATCAKVLVAKLNEHIQVNVYDLFLDQSNALDIIAGYDFIIDATDNFMARYIINDACMLLKKPLVYGAVSQWQGQVTVFDQTINYRDIFPEAPQPGEVLNCEEAGTLGILPGIIGLLQANEIIKLVTGIGKPLIGTLLTYDSLNNHFFAISLTAREATRSAMPADEAAFKQMDYAFFCNASFNTNEITIDDFSRLLAANKTTVIDVREAGEQPFINTFDHLQIPLSVFDASAIELSYDTVVVFCQSGKRSKQAANRLSQSSPNKKIYSLAGGIQAWLNKIHEQST